MSKPRDVARILGRTEAANPNNLALSLDGSTQPTTQYDSIGLLPVTGLTAGTQAFVTSTNRLYVSNGSGWYNVALINATPTLSISPSGAVTLAVDGSTPTVITLTGTDSDNADASLVYSVESDGSFANIATLSQDSSVFTITPLAEGSATPGSSTLTFKASDGINFGSGTTTFSLAFATDWATVTPTETHIVNAAVGNGDKFGLNHFGLSTDGTYAIFGASSDDTDYTNRGIAYVYHYSGGSWAEQTTLEPPTSDKKASLEFGLTCDISGDGSIAVVSALNYGTYAGAAYVFTRSGTTWTYRARLTASDAADYDVLGGEDYQHATTINKTGTHIVCGSVNDDDGNSNRGSAYVYVTADGGVSWTQQQKIAPSYQSGSSQAFGNATAFNNDATYMAIASKNMNKSGTSTNTGVVFIYTRSGTTWTEQAFISPSDGAASDNFGWHISMNGAGDRIFVTSKYDDDGGADSSGSVYVFTRSGSTWTQAAKLTKATPVASNYWGSHINCNETGDTFVVVGEGQYVGADAGRVYIWKDNGTDGTSWSLIKTLTSANDTNTVYGFGDHNGYTRISRDGKVIVNSAGGAGPPLNGGGGRAYIFNT
jgi:hypothetical protein